MQEILNEIQKQIEQDKRNPYEIHNMLKQLGLYMFTTNTINKDNVICFCSSLIKLYQILTKKE